MRGIARVCGAAALAVLTLLHLPPAPAQAEGGLFAGGCALDLHVWFTPAVGLVPGPGRHTFSGTGACIVNGTAVTATFSGTFNADPVVGFGCAAGVGHGEGRFILPLPDFPNPVVQLVIVNNGGSITLTAFLLPATFEGVGELVQSPGSTAACALGEPISSTTWTGPFAFQDPAPSEQ